MITQGEISMPNQRNALINASRVKANAELMTKSNTGRKVIIGLQGNKVGIRRSTVFSQLSYTVDPKKRMKFANAITKSRRLTNAPRGGHSVISEYVMFSIDDAMELFSNNEDVICYLKQI